MIKVKKKRLTLICLSLALDFLAKKTLNICFLYEFKNLISDKIHRQETKLKSVLLNRKFTTNFVNLAGYT